jgi:hypothetical protein
MKEIVKKVIPAAAVIASLAACSMTGDEPARAFADEERLLAEAVGNRTVAGRPQQCVQSRELGGNRGVGANIIVFDGPGQGVYVNRTRSECPRIGDWNTVVVRSTGSSLCANDIIHVVDLQNGVDYGACSLGEFTPYRRGG